MVTNGRTPQIVIAALLGGLAVVLILFATDPGEPAPTGTTFPLAVPDVATTTLPTTTTPTREPTFAGLLPEVDGTLYALINGANDSPLLRLVTWNGDEAPDMRGISAGAYGFLQIDVSGDRAGFIGSSPAGEGRDLWISTGQGFWFSLASGVQAFSWHNTQRGLIAWQDPTQICRTDFNSEESVEFECITSPPGELIGYGDRGFLVREDNEVLLLDTEGNVQQRHVVEDAKFSPDGQILLIDSSSEGDRTFMLVDTDDNVALLPWAPLDAGGEYGFVEWGPQSLLAFLRHTDEDSTKVSIYWPWGRHVSTFDLPDGRFWNLMWSTNGRFMVLPGLVDERDHVALVLDVLTGEQTIFPHPTWVQDAHLVTTRCMDASPMIDGLATYLDDQTESSLLHAEAVLSRDLSLESWLFISATVSDGPHHGEIATWTLPGFNFVGEQEQLPRLVPANEIAADLEPGIANPYSAADYGVEDWMDLDGAIQSVECLAR